MSQVNLYLSKKSVVECVLDPWFPVCGFGAELLACVLGIIDSLPYSIRYLLEAAIRNCDGFQVNKEDVEKILDWVKTSPKQVEIPFKPARVILQVIWFHLCLILLHEWSLEYVVDCSVGDLLSCILVVGTDSNHKLVTVLDLPPKGLCVGCMTSLEYPQWLIWLLCVMPSHARDVTQRRSIPW